MQVTECHHGMYLKYGKDLKKNWSPGEKVENEVEPHCDKTNKMACAPSQDSYQPGQPPSLIRVFAVSLKKATH